MKNFIFNLSIRLEEGSFNVLKLEDFLDGKGRE